MPRLRESIPAREASKSEVRRLEHVGASEGLKGLSDYWGIEVGGEVGEVGGTR